MPFLIPISDFHVFWDALVPLENLLVQTLNFLVSEFASQDRSEVCHLSPNFRTQLRVCNHRHQEGVFILSRCQQFGVILGNAFITAYRQW